MQICLSQLWQDSAADTGASHHATNTSYSASEHFNRTTTIAVEDEKAKKKAEEEAKNSDRVAQRFHKITLIQVYLSPGVLNNGPLAGASTTTLNINESRIS